jgi:hypothetical protein
MSLVSITAYINVYTRLAQYNYVIRAYKRVWNEDPHICNIDTGLQDIMTSVSLTM